MKLIFGSTNKTKLKDLLTLIEMYNLDIELLTMTDIGWDRGEIEENGLTCEENAMIKARAIQSFCKDHNIKFSILVDDSGLFVKALNGRPGVHTARYAQEEIEQNPALTKNYQITKMLEEMKDKEDRSAYFKSCNVYIDELNNITTAEGYIYGSITRAPHGEIPKIPLYSIFMCNEFGKTYNNLTEQELMQAHRCLAFKNLFDKLGLTHFNENVKLK